MAPNYDSILEINNQKSEWCFMARVIRLSESIDTQISPLPLSIDLVLMDCYGHKIDATIGGELITKFQQSVKEGGVYIMYNFYVTLNQLELKTTSHEYFLNFTSDTKIKAVENELVPIYSYVFTHPAEFLSRNYRSEVLVDVVGMLDKVQVGDDCMIDGEVRKTVSMELVNNGYRFKCILHSRFVDELSEFLMSGSSNNACVAMIFGRIKSWKGEPTVHHLEQYTKMLFNPNFNAAVNLKQRMSGTTFAPCKHLYPSAPPKLHIFDWWVLSTARSTVYGLRNCGMESVSLLLASVEVIEPDFDWWYLSCVCRQRVTPDRGYFYCPRCQRHILTAIPRYMIRIRVRDNTGSITIVMDDLLASKFFGMSCKNMLELAGEGALNGQVPEQVQNMVGNWYLFMVVTNLRGRDGANICYRVTKISEDDVLIQSFKHHHSIE